MCHVGVVNVIPKVVEFRVFHNVYEKKYCVTVSVKKELIILGQKWVIGTFPGGFDMMNVTHCLWETWVMFMRANMLSV